MLRSLQGCSHGGPFSEVRTVLGKRTNRHALSEAYLDRTGRLMVYSRIRTACPIKITPAGKISFCSSKRNLRRVLQLCNSRLFETTPAQSSSTLQTSSLEPNWPRHPTSNLRGTDCKVHTHSLSNILWLTGPCGSQRLLCVAGGDDVAFENWVVGPKWCRWPTATNSTEGTLPGCVQCKGCGTWPYVSKRFWHPTPGLLLPTLPLIVFDNRVFRVLLGHLQLVLSHFLLGPFGVFG